MMHRTSEIGGIKIGDEYPVRIAIEIGTYFGTDLERAKDYIRFAKEIGADFLKTEILHDLSIIHDLDMVHTYNTDHGPKTENYRALLERKLVSLEDYEKLIRHAMSQGLPVIASVYDTKGVDLLVSCRAAAAKVASQNVTNRPLIEYCARSGLPLVMDTGNALFHEVAAAVYWAETAGVKCLILNHRPDGSPCPANEQNIRIIRSHAEAFGWPIGFSCHYDGDEMIYLAIGMGARLIEKPTYHKKERDDQDTMFTLHYDKFREMVKKIRSCSDALGDGVRRKQVPYQLECRACLAAGKDIGEGEALTFENVIFPWPMKGIPASQWREAEGLTTSRRLRKGEPITWRDVRR